MERIMELIVKRLRVIKKQKKNKITHKMAWKGRAKEKENHITMHYA